MKLLGRCLGLSLLVAVLMFAPTNPAHAQGDCNTTAELGDVTRTCAFTGSETATLFATSHDDGHVYAVRPQCADGGQVLCFDTQVCVADDGDPGVAMNVYRDGVLIGETCLSGAQAAGLGTITPGLVRREFEQIDWPASSLSVQPPNGRSIVNFPTNFYTDNVGPTVQVITLLGQPISIEATPAEYVYRFDATQSRRTASPGAAYPDLAVTHEYPYAGTAAPAVDTVYVGRYRIGGRPWRDIPGSITVAGAPVPLELVEVRPTLVGSYQ